MKIKNNIKLQAYHFRGRHKASPYTMRHVFWYGILMFLPTACTIDDSTEKRAAEQEMQLVITRAEGDPLPSESTFLFWYSSDLNKIGIGTGEATPYHVAQPPGGIDDYENTKYATGKPYPTDYRRIGATGYSPNTLVASGTYGVLTLPADSVGVCDVMAASPVYGSVSTAFSDPLVFEHVQAKIFFKAIRKKDMVNFVKYVRAETAYPWLVEKLQWNNTLYKYEAVGFADSDPGKLLIGQKPEDNMLSTCIGTTPTAADDYRELGTIHIIPGQGGMKLNVIAQIAPPSDEANILDNRYESRADEVEIEFKDSNGNNITLQAGDSYEVIIVFEDGSFTFMGRKADWQNGGNIVLPVPL